MKDEGMSNLKFNVTTIVGLVFYSKWRKPTTNNVVEKANYAEG